MSLDTGRYQLYSAQKTLGERWQDVEEHWQDAVARDFAARYVEPLEQRLRAALAAIDRLGQVISRARHECDTGDL